MYQFHQRPAAAAAPASAAPNSSYATEEVESDDVLLQQQQQQQQYSLPLASPGSAVDNASQTRMTAYETAEEEWVNAPQPMEHEAAAAAADEEDVTSAHAAPLAGASPEEVLQWCRRITIDTTAAPPREWRQIRFDLPASVAALRLHPPSPERVVGPQSSLQRPSSCIVLLLEGSMPDGVSVRAYVKDMVQYLLQLLRYHQSTTALTELRVVKRGQHVLQQLVATFGNDVHIATRLIHSLRDAGVPVDFGEPRPTRLEDELPACATFAVMDFNESMHQQESEGEAAVEGKGVPRGVTPADLITLFAPFRPSHTTDVVVLKGFEQGLFYVPVKRPETVFSFLRNPRASVLVQSTLFERYGVLVTQAACHHEFLAKGVPYRFQQQQQQQQVSGSQHSSYQQSKHMSGGGSSTIGLQEEQSSWWREQQQQLSDEEGEHDAHLGTAPPPSYTAVTNTNANARSSHTPPPQAGSVDIFDRILPPQQQLGGTAASAMEEEEEALMHSSKAREAAAPAAGRVPSLPNYSTPASLSGGGAVSSNLPPDYTAVAASQPPQRAPPPTWDATEALQQEALRGVLVDEDDDEDEEVVDSNSYGMSILRTEGDDRRIGGAAGSSGSGLLSSSVLGVPGRSYPDAAAAANQHQQPALLPSPAAQQVSVEEARRVLEQASSVFMAAVEKKPNSTKVEGDDAQDDGDGDEEVWSQRHVLPSIQAVESKDSSDDACWLEIRTASSSTSPLENNASPSARVHHIRRIPHQQQPHHSSSGSGGVVEVEAQKNLQPFLVKHCATLQFLMRPHHSSPSQQQQQLSEVRRSLVGMFSLPGPLLLWMASRSPDPIRTPLLSPHGCAVLKEWARSVLPASSPSSFAAAAAKGTEEESDGRITTGTSVKEGEGDDVDEETNGAASLVMAEPQREAEAAALALRLTEELLPVLLTAALPSLLEVASLSLESFNQQLQPSHDGAAPTGSSIHISRHPLVRHVLAHWPSLIAWLEDEVKPPAHLLSAVGRSVERLLAALPSEGRAYCRAFSDRHHLLDQFLQVLAARQEMASYSSLSPTAQMVLRLYLNAGILEGRALALGILTRGTATTTASTPISAGSSGLMTRGLYRFLLTVLDSSFVSPTLQKETAVFSGVVLRALEIHLQLTAQSASSPGIIIVGETECFHFFSAVMHAVHRIPRQPEANAAYLSLRQAYFDLSIPEALLRHHLAVSSNSGSGHADAESVDEEEAKKQSEAAAMKQQSCIAPPLPAIHRLLNSRRIPTEEEVAAVTPPPPSIPPQQPQQQHHPYLAATPPYSAGGTGLASTPAASTQAAAPPSSQLPPWDPAWTAALRGYPAVGPPFHIPLPPAFLPEPELSRSYGHYYFKPQPQRRGVQRAPTYKHPMSGKEYMASPQAFLREAAGAITLKDVVQTAQQFASELNQPPVTLTTADEWFNDQRLRHPMLDGVVMQRLKINYRPREKEDRHGPSSTAKGAGGNSGGAVLTNARIAQLLAPTASYPDDPAVPPFDLPLPRGWMAHLSTIHGLYLFRNTMAGQHSSSSNSISAAGSCLHPTRRQFYRVSPQALAVNRKVNPQRLRAAADVIIHESGSPAITEEEEKAWWSAQSYRHEAFDRALIVMLRVNYESGEEYAQRHAPQGSSSRRHGPPSGEPSRRRSQDRGADADHRNGDQRQAVNEEEAGAEDGYERSRGRGRRASEETDKNEIRGDERGEDDQHEKGDRRSSSHYGSGSSRPSSSRRRYRSGSRDRSRDRRRRH